MHLVKSCENDITMNNSQSLNIFRPSIKRNKFRCIRFTGSRTPILFTKLHLVQFRPILLQLHATYGYMQSYIHANVCPDATHRIWAAITVRFCW